MKTALFPIALSLSLAAGIVSAQELDGSKPLICKPASGHDCLPTEKTCKALAAEPGKDLSVHINIGDMRVKTPYRNDLLPIHSFDNNSRSLTLQGTTLDLVWSAAIVRKTGALTLAIADREGAYVIFGECKLAK